MKLISLLLLATLLQQPNPREAKVREDRRKVEEAGYWKYHDFAGAMAEAKSTGKPVIAVLRCIPCEECVKLDDDLVNNDPELKPLLDRFVRVRIVGTNGLDLSLFQFDTDQSFAVFLLNADGTIYGRFGTRSHRTNWVGDVSIKGLAAALRGALDLHARYDDVKASLSAKRGPKPEVPTPEKFPTLKGKFTDKLDYQGNVVKSCIHCHQVSEARHEFHRAESRTLTDELIFPYPHPKSIGLTLDPNDRATVSAVNADGPTAAFKTGDKILSLNGQPLLSIADVQWVLHGIPAAGGTLTANIERNGNMETVTVTLKDGWRRAGDISWRASTWGLRRMVLGGMVLESADAGFRVKHVGQFGAHAAAKNAGVKAGDRVLAYGGQTYSNESLLIADALAKRQVGEKVRVDLERDGKRMSVTIPIQN